MDKKGSLESIRNILKQIPNKYAIENNPDNILNHILGSEQLLQQLVNVSESFWEDLLRDGAYIFESYENKNELEPNEYVSCRYINYQQGPTTAAIVLEKKRNRR